MKVDVIKALANDKRLLVLEWLKNPRKHFGKQIYGDLVEDGVCGLLIARKLGISPPTLSVHMRHLTSTGLVKGKKIRQWVFYKRDERRIERVVRSLANEL